MIFFARAMAAMYSWDSPFNGRFLTRVTVTSSYSSYSSYNVGTAFAIAKLVYNSNNYGNYDTQITIVLTGFIKYQTIVNGVLMGSINHQPSLGAPEQFLMAKYPEVIQWESSLETMAESTRKNLEEWQRFARFLGQMGYTWDIYIYTYTHTHRCK